MEPMQLAGEHWPCDNLFLMDVRKSSKIDIWPFHPVTTQHNMVKSTANLEVLYYIMIKCIIKQTCLLFTYNDYAFSVARTKEFLEMFVVC